MIELKLAQRMGRIQPSATLALTARAKALAAEGKDVIALTADARIASGVEKSGSPAVRAMTSLPSARSALARAVSASVAEGWIRPMRWASLSSVMSRLRSS